MILQATPEGYLCPPFFRLLANENFTHTLETARRTYAAFFFNRKIQKRIAILSSVEYNKNVSYGKQFRRKEESKMYRRWLSLLLAVCMVWTLIVPAAQAEEAEETALLTSVADSGAVPAARKEMEAA